eukprot:SAG22_NODE_1081_length_5654_cov_4.719352_5_plen_88_part_00
MPVPMGSRMTNDDSPSKTRGPKTNWFGRNKFAGPIFDHYFVRPSSRTCTPQPDAHPRRRCGLPGPSGVAGGRIDPAAGRPCSACSRS